MIKVFICYGGSKGRNIGLALRSYLANQGLRPFLGGLGSPDIPAGENLDVVIDERLRNTHIMVTICDSGIMRSKYARKEIEIAKEEGILNIPFLLSGLHRPEKLSRVWSPITYDPTNLQEAFPRLLLEIHRSIEFRAVEFFKQLGTQPENGLPLIVLRRTSEATGD